MVDGRVLCSFWFVGLIVASVFCFTFDLIVSRVVFLLGLLFCFEELFLVLLVVDLVIVGGFDS